MPVLRVVSAVFVSLSFHLATALCSYAVVPAGQWEEVSSGIRGNNLRIISASPSIPAIAFLSSEQAVYKTTDGGSSWEEVLSFRGREAQIHTVLISPGRSEVVYAGTDDGLYRSRDGGAHWERIYNNIGNLQKSVLAVHVSASDTHHISVGTKSGYFRSDDNGKEWQRSQDIPSESAVTSLAGSGKNPDTMFAVTGRRIFKSMNSGRSWESILRLPHITEDNLLPSGSESNGAAEAQRHSNMPRIVIHPEDAEKVFAGTSTGLLVSNNGGQTWEAAGNASLFVKDIRDMVMHGTGMYAATPRGVYRYSETGDEWENMYRGLVSADIISLASSPAHIWAVSSNRVYKLIPAESRSHSRESGLTTGDILKAFALEPTVEEIREAAIQYAEVSPSKIQKWRKAAARRAWLPDLRFAYDKGKDWQSSDYFYSGNHVADDITVDKDRGWSILLTWELGDLVWNSDQTSIDNRSKLMVQLRDDILNEVTRLYFERRKLQVDMMLAPPGDVKEGVEKALRLQELTAGIDSLTGSYLSQRLQQVSGAGGKKSLKEMIPLP